MSFDPTWLFISLFPSGAGFVLFTYGRKQDRLPHIVAGLLLMVYPYFTPSLSALIGVGAAICAADWFAIRAGY